MNKEIRKLYKYTHVHQHIEKYTDTYDVCVEVIYFYYFDYSTGTTMVEKEIFPIPTHVCSCGSGKSILYYSNLKFMLLFISLLLFNPKSG